MAELESPRKTNEVSSDIDDFYRISALKLKWGDLSNRTVMDIGCGNGESTVRFVDLFPEVKRVIGIDHSARTLEEAIRDEKIDYQTASLDKEYSLSLWMGKMMRVISSYHFQNLKNQEKAFQTLYHLLRPGGKAALLFHLESAFYEWLIDLRQTVIESPKWKDYFEVVDIDIPESHVKQLRSSHYKQMLEEAGFVIILCKDFRTEHTFTSYEACKTAALSTCSLSDYVPDDLKEELNVDMLQSFLKHCRRDGDESFTAWEINLQVLIKRPKEKIN